MQVHWVPWVDGIVFRPQTIGPLYPVTSHGDRRETISWDDDSEQALISISACHRFAELTERLLFLARGYTRDDVPCQAPDDVRL